MAVFSLSAWMNIVSTWRLRACSMACSNKRRPKPRRRPLGRTETPNSDAAARPRDCIGVAVRQVGEGDQLEAAIEDAEHLVVLEVERVDVAADLGVAGGVAEAEVARALVEAHQVSGDPLAVSRAERADRHPGPARAGGRGRGPVDGRGGGRRALRSGRIGGGEVRQEVSWVNPRVNPKCREFV